MENTEEYRKLVAELLVGRKERIPSGNGTVSNLIERLTVFKDVLSELDKDLANLGNNYVANNHRTTEQINELQEINKETVIEFTNSLDLPGIKAE
jgi:hypothetical protein